uniref:Uncharacterized protein n=1 Tax=viral metagenome TaxID=1070528 RepID=A0A6C0BKH5_9ZZZZ
MSLNYSVLPQEVLFNAALYGPASPLLSSEYIAKEMSLINPNFKWCLEFIIAHDKTLQGLSRQYLRFLGEPFQNGRFKIMIGRWRLPFNPDIVPQSIIMATECNNQSLSQRYPHIFPSPPSSVDIIDAVRRLDPKFNFGAVFRRELDNIRIDENLRRLMEYDPQDPYMSLYVRSVLNGDIKRAAADKDEIIVDYSRDDMVPLFNQEARKTFPQVTVGRRYGSWSMSVPSDLVDTPGGGRELMEKYNTVTGWLVRKVNPHYIPPRDNNSTMSPMGPSSTLSLSRPVTLQPPRVGASLQRPLLPSNRPPATLNQGLRPPLQRPNINPRSTMTLRPPSRVIVSPPIQQAISREHIKQYIDPDAQ